MWRFLWRHVPWFHSALCEFLARNRQAQGKVVVAAGWQLLSYQRKGVKLDGLGHDEQPFLAGGGLHADDPARAEFCVAHSEPVAHRPLTRRSEAWFRTKQPGWCIERARPGVESAGSSLGDRR